MPDITDAIDELNRRRNLLRNHPNHADPSARSFADGYAQAVEDLASWAFANR